MIEVTTLISAITYAPESISDEFPMVGRKSPADWLVKLSDGTPACDDVNAGGSPTPLTDGEAITFVRKTHYGAALLTINLDGSLAVDRAMPPEAERCRWKSESSVGTSVEQVARGIINTLGGTRRAAGVYDIVYYSNEYEDFEYDPKAGALVPAQG